jgi:hypothetical protein
MKRWASHSVLHSIRYKIRETHSIHEIRQVFKEENVLHIKSWAACTFATAYTIQASTHSWLRHDKESASCLHVCTPNEASDYTFQNICSYLCSAAYLGWISSIADSWRITQCNVDAHAHTHTHRGVSEAFEFMWCQLTYLEGKRGSISLEFAMWLGRPCQYWKRPARDLSLKLLHEWMGRYPRHNHLWMYVTCPPAFR